MEVIKYILSDSSGARFWMVIIGLAIGTACLLAIIEAMTKAFVRLARLIDKMPTPGTRIAWPREEEEEEEIVYGK